MSASGGQHHLEETVPISSRISSSHAISSTGIVTVLVLLPDMAEEKHMK
jgi:hypothetical protein